ncbi:MAG: alpha/beta hydrolase [Actinomycetota bacterium]|nr:alpha/beta hydrolase [Actinomycetota bacterium]
MTITERFTTNDGIRLRWLDNAPAVPEGLPVLFSPGFSDYADEYVEMLHFMAPRRVVVVEVRGRGGSDAHEDADYSAPQHAADLRAVVNDAGFDRFHVMTFSRGTTWGLELAFNMRDRVASISIGDYWAKEHGVTEEMARGMLASRFRGKPLPERIDEHVVLSVFRESRERPFANHLADMPCPVLLAHGTEEGRLVDEDGVAEYRAARPDIEVVTIHGAAHDLFRHDRHAYPRAVLAFIANACPGQ